MSEADPIGLLFGGMEKLGPGSKEDTTYVLNLLPEQPYQLIVDAGCGSGRQTLTLAKKLETVIHAVDTYEPFLSSLKERAKIASINDLIETHCIDMGNIPDSFQGIDLLWSEGSAYNIGFENALNRWQKSLNMNGILVVSELSWLSNTLPVSAKHFFDKTYPSMQSQKENILVSQNSGYQCLATHTLPKEAWVDNYYSVLEPKANSLLNHQNESVRSLACNMIEEIGVFNSSENSYGYVFYVLQKT